LLAVIQSAGQSVGDCPALKLSLLLDAGAAGVAVAVFSRCRQVVLVV
jgi:hypothetical protein